MVNVKGRGKKRSWSTIMNYSGMYLELLMKTKKTSATTAGLQAEILTGNLPNRKQEWYHSAAMFGPAFLRNNILVFTYISISTINSNIFPNGVVIFNMIQKDFSVSVWCRIRTINWHRNNIFPAINEYQDQWNRPIQKLTMHLHSCFSWIKSCE